MILPYLNWNISPEIFRIGPVAVRWYGLLFASGFVIGYYIMLWIFNSEKKKQSDLEALTITMILGTVIGARLGHCLFYDPIGYLSNPLSILKVWEGGLASHGAAIGIITALYIYVRKRPDISLLWILDRIVIVVALSGFLIRMGNFFNSEILGSPADVSWAVIFSRIDMIPRHPAQLYESFTYLAIFIYLLNLYRTKKGTEKPGYLFGSFLVFVFDARFIIERYKEVQSTFEKGWYLDLGQLLSIPFIIIGLYFMLRKNPNKKSSAG